MIDIATVLPQLRMPFAPEKVNFKVQTTKKDNTAALVVGYIDARDVSERLNNVCPGQWSNKHRELLIDGKLEGVTCTITLRDDNNAIVVEDIGVGSPIERDMEQYQRDVIIKTYWSDSFKRAAVKLGVAESLYELPQIWINSPDCRISNGKIVGINKDGQKGLKQRYSDWVTSEVIKNRFGVVYA